MSCWTPADLHFCEVRCNSSCSKLLSFRGRLVQTCFHLRDNKLQEDQRCCVVGSNDNKPPARARCRGGPKPGLIRGRHPDWVFSCHECGCAVLETVPAFWSCISTTVSGGSQICTSSWRWAHATRGVLVVVQRLGAPRGCSRQAPNTSPQGSKYTIAPHEVAFFLRFGGDKATAC